MNRRSFITACIATMTAPAIVRASSLMPVSVRKSVTDFPFVMDGEWYCHIKVGDVSGIVFETRSRVVTGGRIITSSAVYSPYYFIPR